jgi:AP-1 complex subunit gamma-1
VQCLALTLVANVATAEMWQSVLPEVQKLIDTGLSPVMKRAAMAALRIVDKMPELMDSFKLTVQKLLKHGSRDVVICAIHLMQHMINAPPDLGPSYARYQPSLTKILKQLDSTVKK